MDRTGQNSYQSQYLKWKHGRILYTPAKLTTKSGRKEEESHQRKHPEQKKTACGGVASREENQKAVKETQEDGEDTKRRTHCT